MTTDLKDCPVCKSTDKERIEILQGQCAIAYVLECGGCKEKYIDYMIV